MTNIETTTAVEAAPVEPKMFAVPLKGDCGEVSVDPSRLPDEVYDMVLLEGLKAVINSVGMSKKLPGITKLEGSAKEKAIAEVRKQAEDNVEALYLGTIKKGGRKAKASGAVQTEALRLAKMLVKDHIRNSGQKIGAYSAKEITEAAKKVLEGNQRLYQQAEANLSERAQEAKKTGGLDLTALFGEKASSEEVKAKPKAPPKRKENGEKQLSAKQAGMVAPRQKPGSHPTH